MNASMYDAQQGSTSGAHIDLSTSLGHQQSARHALRAPRHELAQRRSVLLQQRPGCSGLSEESGAAPVYCGRHVGGPIIKDKLFGLPGVPAFACLGSGAGRLVSGCSGGADRTATATASGSGEHVVQPEEHLARSEQHQRGDNLMGRTSIRPRWRCSTRRRSRVSRASG